MISLSLKKNIFNEVYLPFIYGTGKRLNILYGGSGSGKSVAIAQRIVYKCLSSQRKILIIRKTLTSQKDSCGRLILDILSQGKIKQYCTVRITDYNIEFPNGSLLLFKGMEDTERIKSVVGITDLWCEECTELSEDEFDQLCLRIRAQVSDTEIYASFNPISKANWVYKRGFEHEVDDDTYILKTTYLDNKFLPEDYINSLKKMMTVNPVYYRVYTLGEFCSLDKLIFSNGRVDDIDNTQVEGKLCVGLDFGYVNDLTSLVASIVDEANKKIYVFREGTCIGKTNDFIANSIKSLGFSKSTIIADSAEQKSIAEIKKAGVIRIRESKKGPDSIVHGIQRLQQYEIIVDPSCENLITELENYSWKKDKHSGEYINQPIDQFNHSIDSLRYSLQCLDINELKTMSKAMLNL